MGAKRMREDMGREEEALDVVKCLMLLSKVGQNDGVAKKESPAGRVFVCKTCNREFGSFQALGGHRASHKKPKLGNEAAQSSPAKPKTHECSICGLEFAIGQALGGHMRRHRHAMENDLLDHPTQQPLPQTHQQRHQPFPVLKKSSSCKRVMLDFDHRGLDLDLNLAPPGGKTYDLKLCI